MVSIPHCFMARDLLAIVIAVADVMEPTQPGHL